MRGLGPPASVTTLDPVFDALADPTRRLMLQRLAAGEELTATGLAGELPITRQAVAKHLNVLDDAGLVSSAKVGREVRYSFEPEPLSEAVDWLATVGAAWDRRLTRLAGLFPDP